MGRLSELAKDRIHTRVIETSTFTVDDSHVLSTGHFRDVRHFPHFGFGDARFEAGILHDLGIHVLIKTPDLIIEDIEVFINTVPNEDCRKLEHSMDAVIGLSVSRGFTEKVKALAGGKAGCTHLVHLLTTMAPAILQGYWALTARRTPRTDEDAKRRAISSAKFLKNSCYAWREDGDVYRKLFDIAGLEPGGNPG